MVCIWMQFFGHGRLISYIQNLWVLMLHADIRHCLNITFAINVDINSKGHIIYYLKTEVTRLYNIQNYMQWYKNIMNPFKKIIRDLLLIVLWSHDFPPCLKTIFNAHTCPFLIHFLSYFEANINSWETKCFYSKQLFYKGNGYFDQFWKSMYLSRVNYKTQVIFSTLLWRSMMVLIKVFSRVQENGL